MEGGRERSSPSLLLPLLCADQLNATGFSQLPPLSLLPEEATESEESQDYY